MHYGELPKNDIYHINRNKLDNRIENLRLVTCSENAWNTELRSDNTSGLRGIRWNEKYKRWSIHLQKEGKRIQKCIYQNKIDAIKDYIKEFTELFSSEPVTMLVIEPHKKELLKLMEVI
jgi:hypothetical protein